MSTSIANCADKAPCCSFRAFISASACLCEISNNSSLAFILSCILLLTSSLIFLCTSASFSNCFIIPSCLASNKLKLLVACVIASDCSYKLLTVTPLKVLLNSSTTTLPMLVISLIPSLKSTIIPLPAFIASSPAILISSLYPVICAVSSAILCWSPLPNQDFSQANCTSLITNATLLKATFSGVIANVIKLVIILPKASKLSVSPVILSNTVFTVLIILLNTKPTILNAVETVSAISWFLIIALPNCSTSFKTIPMPIAFIASPTPLKPLAKPSIAPFCFFAVCPISLTPSSIFPMLSIAPFISASTSIVTFSAIILFY